MRTEQLSGRLVHRERQVRRPAGLQVARPVATAMVMAAWAPLLVVPGLCLALALAWVIGLVGVVVLTRQAAQPDDARPDPRAAEELVLSTGPGRRTTVSVRGYLVGPAHPGDLLVLTVRPRHGVLDLVEGRNTSQDDAALRPPHDPWPTALVLMLVSGVALLPFAPW